MGTKTTAIDLTEGITEYSSRIALKMLFGQFGEVTACWIPPLEHRGSERSYVKFGTTKAAQAAIDAAASGNLFLDGVKLGAEWRLAPARTQDTRDFEARGSNLHTSRDLMRAQVRGKGGGRDNRDARAGGGGRRDMDGGSRSLFVREREQERDRGSGRDNGRDKKAKDRDRSRERERDRKRNKSRSRSRERKKKSKSRGRKSRSKSRRKRSAERPKALQDAEKVEESSDADSDDDNTTAVI
eukprot:TRINITY_DN41121_c0_g1_i1.p1 TRINITY_DN41121_c0_g1~~TRINITY_DN41121_c0_g1_i1.p1  ORF type:complete len:241 (-),score=43.91 TRINITY_DN41121_c0_g1_i1:188-910(-)